MVQGGRQSNAVMMYNPSEAFIECRQERARRSREWRIKNSQVTPQTAHGPPAFFGLGAFVAPFCCCHDPSSWIEDVCPRAAGASALLMGLLSGSCSESPEDGLVRARRLEEGALRAALL